MTATMNTTCAGGEVNTPSESETGGEWFARHVERVFAAVNNNTFVIGNATRLYTSWPTETGTHTVTTIRYLGPPPESNNDFLNRHLEDAAADVPNFPPVP
jgi:hypothetical protein